MIKAKIKEAEPQKDLAVVESPPPQALNPKQQRFVEEYVIDLNGTQAAIRAGYSEKTANEQAAQLLAKLSVRRAVERLQEEISVKLGITKEKILTELSHIGFSNMSDYLKCTSDGDPYFDYYNSTREQRSALSEVTVEDYVDGRGDDARSVKKVKFKLHDKRSALVDLGRHLGMFTKAEEAGGAISDRTFVREVLEMMMGRYEKRANAIEV